MTAIIKNWALVGQGPNGLGRLAGEVYNHPRFYDGADVLTSFVIKAHGRSVVTYSGTNYLLEEPCEEYLSSLSRRGIDYDPEKPIKHKKIEAFSQSFEEI